MLIQKIHHVAYRCINAKQTVEWYTQHLDMKFVLAIAEDEDRLACDSCLGMRDAEEGPL